ncbi:MAG: hypothetical protein ABIR96_04710 [Bdellovibrionota bacterium]
MSKILLSTTLLTLSLPTFAASFALSGNYRFGTNMLVNTDLADGKKSGAGNTSSFLEQRFLLRPDVLIDEHFTVKSELNLLQANSINGANQVPPYFGAPLDSNTSQQAGQEQLVVSQLYLNWASDWGLFRFGRIPKSWGLGLLYDAGEDAFDDYKTVRDRADFQAMLGNLGLRFAFEKGAESVLNGDYDDMDTYELAIDYSNADGSSNVGILYSRNIRSQKVGGLNSSHDVSLFAKKTWNKFQLGAEFASIAEEHRNASSGLLAQADMNLGNFSIGYDLAYASASSNSSFKFNPNYRPFMFLFRQSLGTKTPSNEFRGGPGGRGVGSDVTADGSSGALVNKLHAAYQFSGSQLTLGSDLGFAKTNIKGASGENGLGFETDLFLSHQWYENFKLQYALGLLVPGKAYGSDPKAAWGFELKGALNF